MVVNTIKAGSTRPELSIILVSYNTATLTKECLTTLLQSPILHSISFEVFIIDNASKDDSVRVIEHAFPDVRLIKNTHNVGFGRANNQVLNQLSGQYVLLLNSDAFVEDNTIEKTLDFMKNHPHTGILGVRLIGRDGELQPSCRYFPTPWNLFVERVGLRRFFKSTQFVDDMTWDHDAVRQCDWVPGCYYLIKREVIERVGLFDHRFFLYYEEVDHCFAVKKAGWDVTYFPGTQVVHIGGESARVNNQISKVSKQVSFLQIESELLYFRKNNNLIGFSSYVILYVLADWFVYFKSLMKSLLNRSNDRKKLATPLFLQILIKTGFGHKPIH